MSKEKVKSAWVYVKKKNTWVDVDDVEFLNISENIFGHDEMNFKYKGKQYSSTIAIGSKPS
jgi:hypothetical protein